MISVNESRGTYRCLDHSACSVLLTSEDGRLIVHIGCPVPWRVVGVKRKHGLFVIAFPGLKENLKGYNEICQLW